MEEVNWGTGLPIDVLALVARGCSELRSMQLVNKTWKLGFDLSITTLKISRYRPAQPLGWEFADRFPCLTSLDISECHRPIEGGPVLSPEAFQVKLWPWSVIVWLGWMGWRPEEGPLGRGRSLGE